MPNSDFALWHPTISSDGLNCQFYVQPSGSQQLNKGDQKVVSGFIKALEINGSSQLWEINPFCSPYFADETGSKDKKAHWRDRFPIIWQITVKFKNKAKFLKPRHYGPISVDGVDSSWKETEYSWKWSERNFVVLGDFLTEETGNKAQTLLLELKSENMGEDVQIIYLPPFLQQIRVNLGLLKFPDDINKAEKLIERCKNACDSINWASTLLLTERAKRKLELLKMIQSEHREKLKS